MFGSGEIIDGLGDFDRNSKGREEKREEKEGERGDR
jgi:hypothetical protein